MSILAAGKVGAAGVVSLSAERNLVGYGDVLPAVRRLASPVLYLYARNDPYAESDTPALFRATRETRQATRRASGLPRTARRCSETQA